MRNTEQIEYELTQLKGKPVYVIVPLFDGRASLSLCGDLQVVETAEHLVGFHLSGVGIAIIFFAEHVVSLEPALTEGFTKTIRLGKITPFA